MSQANDPELRAREGDRLVVRGHHQGEPQRDGEILKVLGDDGAPPFLVRWEDGHESEVFPGSDMFVQHFDQQEAKKRSSRSTTSGSASDVAGSNT
jgi:uncharacterized protein DUF1918